MFSANTKLDTDSISLQLLINFVSYVARKTFSDKIWNLACSMHSCMKTVVKWHFKFQVGKYAEKSYLWWQVRSLERLMQHHGKPLPCHQNLNWSLLVWINVQIPWLPSNPALKENPCWFLFNKYNPFQAVKMFCTVYVETACTFLQSQVLIQGTQSWYKVFCLHISIMTTLSVQK